MLITTGTVHGGTITIDAKGLPDGAIVIVLAPEGDETFDPSPEEEAKLLRASAEADRGETISASQILHQIPRS